MGTISPVSTQASSQPVLTESADDAAAAAEAAEAARRAAEEAAAAARQLVEETAARAAELTARALQDAFAAQSSTPLVDLTSSGETIAAPPTLEESVELIDVTDVESAKEAVAEGKALFETALAALPTNAAYPLRVAFAQDVALVEQGLSSGDPAMTPDVVAAKRDLWVAVAASLVPGEDPQAVVWKDGTSYGSSLRAEREAVGDWSVTSRGEVQDLQGFLGAAILNGSLEAGQGLDLLNRAYEFGTSAEYGMQAGHAQTPEERHSMLWGAGEQGGLSAMSDSRNLGLRGLRREFSQALGLGDSNDGFGPSAEGGVGATSEVSGGAGESGGAKDDFVKMFVDMLKKWQTRESQRRSSMYDVKV
jgi:hypothetical protein